MEINKYKVNKKITEHIDSLQVGGGGDKFNALAFSCEWHDKKGGLETYPDFSNDYLVMTDNFPLDNIWYTEADRIGMLPNLQVGIVGKCDLYIVVHPDIYSHEATDGSLYHLVLGPGDLSSGSSLVVGWMPQTGFNGFTGELVGGYALVGRVEFAYRLKEDYYTCLVFVGSLEELEKDTNNFYFRVQNDAVFQKVSFGKQTYEFDKPEGRISSLSFSQTVFRDNVVFKEIE